MGGGPWGPWAHLPSGVKKLQHLFSAGSGNCYALDFFITDIEATYIMKWPKWVFDELPLPISTV